jgi:hypothetical protein
MVKVSCRSYETNCGPKPLQSAIMAAREWSNPHETVKENGSTNEGLCSSMTPTSSTSR